MPAQQREQAAVAASLLIPVRDQRRQVRSVGEEPFQTPLELRQPLEEFGLECLDGEQRYEPDHRAHLEGLHGAIRQMQHVVEEFVVVVPQTDTALIAADVGHGLRDVQKVLEELGGNVLVHVVVLCELERNAHEIERVHRHPAGAVGLIDVTAGGQLTAAVEHTDIVESEKAALEDVAPLDVLAVHPPGEVEYQLVEYPLEELQIALPAALLAVDLEHAPGRPGVHRRVDVAKGPLVGGDLAIRVHVPLARQQDELLLGECGVQVRQWQAMESQIPGRVPRVFPLVGHGNDIGVVQMPPVSVAAVPARGRRWWLRRVALQPSADIEVKELLAPDHSGKRLALDEARIGAVDALLQMRVEVIRLAQPAVKNPLEVRERLGQRAFRQAQPDVRACAPGDLQQIPHCGPGALPGRIDRCGPFPDHTIMKGIFPVAAARGVIPQPLGVGFVVAEQKLARIAVGV